MARIKKEYVGYGDVMAKVAPRFGMQMRWITRSEFPATGYLFANSEEVGYIINRGIHLKKIDYKNKVLKFLASVEAQWGQGELELEMPFPREGDDNDSPFRSLRNFFSEFAGHHID